jgi:hypothetical protein
VDANVGYALPFLAQPLYDSGDGLTFNALRQFWASTYDQAISNQPNVLPPVPPVVYINGVAQAPLTGYSVNYTEGSITFTSTQAGKTITADYTATIPDLVRDATVDQVTYLLTQRALTQAGIGGLEQVRNGNQQIRRSRTDDAEEDQLCAKARLKLAKFVPIAIA